MGPGRWDAESLAADLECSTRTVHRILQTLSMASVPWFFCKESLCYRVRPGFRFPGIEVGSGDGTIETQVVLDSAEKLLKDSEQFVDSLRRFCETLSGDANQDPS